MMRTMPDMSPIWEEICKSLFVLLDKRRFNALFNHQIVRCDAGLTGVEHLAESDAPRGSGRFAVSSTMMGLLPPSSSVTGVSRFAAASMTVLPTATLPVKNM